MSNPRAWNLLRRLETFFGVLCLAAASHAQEAVAFPPSPTPLAVENTLGPAGGVKACAPHARSWIRNDGQWDPMWKYMGRTHGAVVRVSDAFVDVVAGDDSTWSSGTVLRLSLGSGASTWSGRGAQERPGVCSFILGADASRHASRVPSFAVLELEDAGRGTTATLRLTEGGLAMDMVFPSGSDAAAFMLTYAGAQGAVVGVAEDYRLDAGAGWFRQQAPQVWVTGDDGERKSIPSSWRQQTVNRLSLLADPTDLDAPVILSTGLEWAGFLGGSFADRVNASAFRPNGEVILAGETLSFDLPTTPGAWDETYTSNGQTPYDAFIVALLADGSGYSFFTYLGAGAKDTIHDLEIFENGDILVGGYTLGGNFPLTAGAFDTEKLLSEGFATRLSADGSDLIGSTFIGGESLDHVLSVAVIRDSDVYIAGETWSTGGIVLVADSWDPTFAGPTSALDGFVMRLDGLLTKQLASTYIGGTGDEQVRDLVLVPDGIVLGGLTSSADLAVTAGAWDTSYGGGQDFFVAKLSLDLLSVSFVTYLGGSSMDSLEQLGVAASGEIVVAGTTMSFNYPVTPMAFLGSSSDDWDGVVSRLDSTGSTLLASTYFGGSAIDNLWGLGVSSSGVVTIAGDSDSPNLPGTPGSFQATKPDFLSKTDLFVAQLDPGLSRVLYCSYLGGLGDESAVGDDGTVCTAPYGDAVVTGLTYSPDAPVTPGSFGPVFKPENDTLVAKLSMLPQGVTRFGASTPGASGLLTMGATSGPALGNTRFALTCSGARAFVTNGLLALSANAVMQPVPAVGAELWLDPMSLILLHGIASDAWGFAVVPLPIPNDAFLSGVQISAQCFWPPQTAPGGWSASNALELTLHP